MEITYDNETYFFELEDATQAQLEKIEKVYDFSLLDLAKGMQQGGISALKCIWWLIQIQNKGHDLLRLESVTLDKPVKFAVAVQAGLLREQQELLDKVEKAVAESQEATEDPKE
jgi:hypothetical protein